MAGVDQVKAAKVVIFDWKEFSADTSEVTQHDWDVEFAM